MDLGRQAAQDLDPLCPHRREEGKLVKAAIPHEQHPGGKGPQKPPGSPALTGRVGPKSGIEDDMGACHGALAGKGGFKLSLRGYDAVADHRTVTRGARGRRIEPTDPGNSLILLKPTM